MVDGMSEGTIMGEVERVRSLLRDALGSGLSGRQLARDSGVDEKSIRAFRDGVWTPRPASLDKLARCLDYRLHASSAAGLPPSAGPAADPATSAAPVHARSRESAARLVASDAA